MSYIQPPLPIINRREAGNEGNKCKESIDFDFQTFKDFKQKNQMKEKQYGDINIGYK